MVEVELPLKYIRNKIQVYLIAKLITSLSEVTKGGLGFGLVRVYKLFLTIQIV